jgi:hypothetical protein
LKPKSKLPPLKENVFLWFIEYPECELFVKSIDLRSGGEGKANYSGNFQFWNDV